MVKFIELNFLENFASWINKLQAWASSLRSEYHFCEQFTKLNLIDPKMLQLANTIPKLVLLRIYRGCQHLIIYGTTNPEHMPSIGFMQGTETNASTCFPAFNELPDHTRKCTSVIHFTPGIKQHTFKPIPCIYYYKYLKKNLAKVSAFSFQYFLP